MTHDDALLTAEYDNPVSCPAHHKYPFPKQYPLSASFIFHPQCSLGAFHSLYCAGAIELLVMDMVEVNIEKAEGASIENKPTLPVDVMVKKVAVIGGGVSGLAAAWHLHQLHSSAHADAKFSVQLFEAEDRLGGHAHTCTIQVGQEKKDLDVDIGFMVFNSGPDCNYPNMTAWFKELGVEEEDSDMSLSVSLDGGKTVEWNSDGLNGLFADRTQFFKPSFYRYISDMLRFNAEAADILSLPKDDPRRVVTTGQYLRDHGYSQPFCTNYLLPMMAALWSASIEDVLQFPAHQLIAFLCNHKMLQLFQRPQVSLCS